MADDNRLTEIAQAVHGIDRHTQDHLCGARAGLGTDALAPSMPITCQPCRDAWPDRREGDCWLCQHPVWGPLCASCGCLAHYPPHPRVEVCVHCGDMVTNPPPGDWWTHARRAPDGTLHTGRSRCQSPDVAYGHLAHPADVPCRADGPNPCLGALNSSPTRTGGQA